MDFKTVRELNEGKRKEKDLETALLNKWTYKNGQIFSKPTLNYFFL